MSLRNSAAGNILLELAFVWLLVLSAAVLPPFLWSNVRRAFRARFPSSFKLARH